MPVRFIPAKVTPMSYMMTRGGMSGPPAHSLPTRKATRQVRIMPSPDSVMSDLPQPRASSIGPRFTSEFENAQLPTRSDWIPTDRGQVVGGMGQAIDSLIVRATQEASMSGYGFGQTITPGPLTSGLIRASYDRPMITHQQSAEAGMSLGTYAAIGAAALAVGALGYVVYKRYKA